MRALLIVSVGGLLAVIAGSLIALQSLQPAEEPKKRGDPFLTEKEMDKVIYDEIMDQHRRFWRRFFRAGNDDE